MHGSTPPVELKQHIIGFPLISVQFGTSLLIIEFTKDWSVEEDEKGVLYNENELMQSIPTSKNRIKRRFFISNKF